MNHFRYQAMEAFFLYYRLHYQLYKGFKTELETIKAFALQSPQEAEQLRLEIRAILEGITAFNQGEVSSIIRSLPKGFGRIKRFAKMEDILSFLEFIQINLTKE